MKDLLPWAIEKEFELGKANVRDAKQIPLDYAGIEVARKVDERPLCVHCEGCHCESWLFSAEKERPGAHIPT